MKKHDVINSKDGPGVVRRAAKDGSWVDIKTKPVGPGKRVSTKSCKKL